MYVCITEEEAVEFSPHPKRMHDPKKLKNSDFIWFDFGFWFFCLFRATPTAYGGSQHRGQIRAIAASLHSHSNARSEPHLQPTPQLRATPEPSPTEQGQGSTCVLTDPSQVCSRWARMGTPRSPILNEAYRPLCPSLAEVVSGTSRAILPTRLESFYVSGSDAALGSSTSWSFFSNCCNSLLR